MTEFVGLVVPAVPAVVTQAYDNAVANAMLVGKTKYSFAPATVRSATSGGVVPTVGLALL